MPRILVAALLLLGACVPPAPAADPAPEGPLVTSLSVRTGGGEVHLLLQVTNSAGDPVELAFPSAQTHDFQVRQGGRVLWTWSADKLFAQALTSRVLAPGETLELDGSWTPPAGVAGELEAEARLTATSHPLARTAAFRLP